MNAISFHMHCECKTSNQINVSAPAYFFYATSVQPVLRSASDDG